MWSAIRSGPSARQVSSAGRSAPGQLGAIGAVAGLVGPGHCDRHRQSPSCLEHRAKPWRSPCSSSPTTPRPSTRKCGTRCTAADAADTPYDTDALSRRLDEAFSALFGREVAALWVATGTAANCLALSTMVAPHGGVLCHREAHIEMDEGGAPGFYLHGAKLVLAEGEGAKLTPETVAPVLDAIRDDVHQVQVHALSLTQASEYGRCYRPDELAALDVAGARARPQAAHGRRALRQRRGLPRLRAGRSLRRRRRAELRLRQERRR